MKRASGLRTALAAASIVVAALEPSLAGPDQGLDRAAVTEAVRIGRTNSRNFHAPYRIAVDDPVVRQIEVITPFRRIVQLTEEREGLRDATWDESRAAAAVRPFEGRLDVVMSLHFPPQNTYQSLPPYSLVIYDHGGGEIRPVDTRSTSAYVGGQPAPPGTPILSGTVTLTFAARDLPSSGTVLAGLLLDGRESRRVAIDLDAIR